MQPPTIVFGVGLAVLAAGVAAWSVAAAAVVVGCVLMSVAAYPFLRRKV